LYAKPVSRFRAVKNRRRSLVWREALREKVYMIGHYTVGMNREGMGERVRAQAVEEPLRAGWLKKDFFSAFAAEGQDNDLVAGGCFCAGMVFSCGGLVARIVMQVAEERGYPLSALWEIFCFRPGTARARPSEDGRYVAARVTSRSLTPFANGASRFGMTPAWESATRSGGLRQGLGGRRVRRDTILQSS